MPHAMPAELAEIATVHNGLFGGFLMPPELAETIAARREAFAGFRMMADEPPADETKAGRPEQQEAGEQAGEDKPLGPAGERALAAVKDENKSLRTELNNFKQGLADALGLENGKKPDADAIGEIQSELADLRRENRVAKLARTHGITDDGDIALLMEASETAAPKLAERLKPTADSGATPPTNGRTFRHTPAPDPSVGKGNGGGTRPSSVRQAMEDIRARTQKNTQS